MRLLEAELSIHLKDTSLDKADVKYMGANILLLYSQNHVADGTYLKFNWNLFPIHNLFFMISFFFLHQGNCLRTKTIHPSATYWTLLHYSALDWQYVTIRCPWKVSITHWISSKIVCGPLSRGRWESSLFNGEAKHRQKMLQSTVIWGKDDGRRRMCFLPLADLWHIWLPATSDYLIAGICPWAKEWANMEPGMVRDDDPIGSNSRNVEFQQWLRWIWQGLRTPCLHPLTCPQTLKSSHPALSRAVL